MTAGRWMRGSALIFAAFVSIPSAAAETASPAELQVTVGGFLGSTYSVSLSDGILVCVERRNGREVSTVRARVAESDWTALRRELDRLDVWTWQASYVDPRVLDGTQWAARIVYPDRKLVSHGSNSFPGAQGRPGVTPEPTVEFQRFTAAVARLAKGCRL